MTILVALIVFSIIVFFHELGHFAVAKKCGVKVHEFSIGMGPKILCIKKAETEYSIRILPLGGFVRMEGEDEKSQDPNGFSNKSILQRISIIFAGPFMNFILAILLFTFIFMYSGIPSTTINKTIVNLPAQKIGLKAGDKIEKINDIKVNTWQDVVSKINSSNNEKILMRIKRENTYMNFSIMPQKIDGKSMIGIEPKLEKNIFLSLEYGTKQSVLFLKEMIHFLAKTFMGQSSWNDVAGPVGIVNVVGQATKAGIINVVFLAAAISLNLGFINLLPIPALDGSRILFLIIEFIRGRKLDPDKEGKIHFIGFVALMMLMVVVTYKDVIKIIFKTIK